MSHLGYLGPTRLSGRYESNDKFKDILSLDGSFESLIAVMFETVDR